MAILDSLLQPPRRYLRYLHLREAVMISRPKTVLMVGVGRGVAEVALAHEFRDIHFHLTDWELTNHNTARAERLARKLKNVSFGKLNILSPDTSDKFDFVGSVEVLEHIKEDDRAAANMISLAGKHVFCLVPFARAADNANPERRQRVWENNQHYVVGYPPERLRELFPNPQVVRGAYWADVSRQLKQEVLGLSTEQVREKAEYLMELAQRDLRPEVPRTIFEAVGIWTLSAPHAQSEARCT